MSESVSEMFGYERETVNNTIIDNYDDFSCDISLPSEVNTVAAIVTVRV